MQDATRTRGDALLKSLPTSDTSLLRSTVNIHACIHITSLQSTSLFARRPRRTRAITTYMATAAFPILFIGHRHRRTAMATAATIEAKTRETLVTKLESLVHRARGVVSRHPVAAGAAVVTVGAVGTYLLWPAVAPTVATMKARVVGVISRAAFLAKKLYFKLLNRQHSAVAAAAEMATATKAETRDLCCFWTCSCVQ